MRSTLMTMPSISYGRLSRLASHSLMNSHTSSRLRTSRWLGFTLKPAVCNAFSVSEWRSKMVRPVRQQKVREEVEPPLSRDVRLQHAHRSRRRVARIGELRQTSAVRVRRSSAGTTTSGISSSPRTSKSGGRSGLRQRLGRNRERHAAHRAHVQSDIFANRCRRRA